MPKNKENRIFHYVNQFTTKRNYEYVLDQYKYDTSFNKQYWVPKSYLENGSLTTNELKELPFGILSCKT
jgi:hypothetical protein